MRFPTQCRSIVACSGHPISHKYASRRWLRTLATTTTAAAALLPVGGTNAWISSSTRPRHFGSTWRQFPVPKYPRLYQEFSAISSGLPPSEQERVMTEDALTIVKQGIEAVDPYKAVRAHFERNDKAQLRIGTEVIDLDRYNQLVLVAFGKASSAMATAVIEQLHGMAGTVDENSLPQISGLVICKDDHATSYEQDMLEKTGISVRFASHPVPDERSSEAAQELVTMVQDSSSPETLVICCISGGGSALFCRPRPPLTLSDLQSTNSLLLGSGMGIQDMNVIRKRLEEGKGGRLAAQSYPSTLVTLILSDVLGDPLDLIASGPTVPDTSNWEDAWKLVHEKSKNLATELPSRVQTMLQEGMEGKLPDSPSPDHAAFETAVTVLVGNNDLAVEAAAETAHRLGYQPIILGSQVEGEATEIAHMYVAMALYLQQQNEKGTARSPYAVASSLPVALIAGGETTVSLPSDCTGKGGRNQELALSAALQMKSLGLRNVVLASVGTDGTDGPTDAAGAVVDGTTVSSGSNDTTMAAARTALSRHDAYTYFAGLSSGGGDDGPSPLIITGPTGTNVADICVTLIQKDESRA